MLSRVSEWRPWSVHSQPASSLRRLSLLKCPTCLLLLLLLLAGCVQVESRINVSLPSAPSHPPPYLSTSICLACPFFMATAR